MIDSTDAWREVSDEEYQEMEPFLLRCAGLGDDSLKIVNEEVPAMLLNCVQKTMNLLKRELTQDEVDTLGKAVVKHMNQHRIPELRAREVLH